jgi:uncharacterized protein (TIGR00369 family)
MQLMTQVLHPGGPPAVLFEDDFIAGLKSIFEEEIAFNRLLGLKIAAVEADAVSASLAMRPELVGNFAHQRVHGGVISAALDTLGGIAVMAALGARHRAQPVSERLAHFGKLGTIDLRVDYLRPGVGENFLMRAQVLRLGSRIANTRMEFMSTDGKVFAAGTGVYIVS